MSENRAHLLLKSITGRKKLHCVCDNFPADLTGVVMSFEVRGVVIEAWHLSIQDQNILSFLRSATVVACLLPSMEILAREKDVKVSFHPKLEWQKKEKPIKSVEIKAEMSDLGDFIVVECFPLKDSPLPPQNLAFSSSSDFLSEPSSRNLTDEKESVSIKYSLSDFASQEWEGELSDEVVISSDEDDSLLSEEIEEIEEIEESDEVVTGSPITITEFIQIFDNSKLSGKYPPIGEDDVKKRFSRLPSVEWKSEEKGDVHHE
eukprot:TRINITY_DN6116_c0_g1_i2.p1 TRINITY_DN6116_c0_g1~~TRINITY_DN6116_c0_g1_i2.p1  ORF type:complete len:261 (-),score=93.68 TRINITY_DN6116_c0_g1_i2:26-808(-)